MDADPAKRLQDQTIADFGRQWTAFTDNGGFYGSQELFRDAFPQVPPEALRGARAADIGSGTGRIVRMLLDAGAAHVTAVEPSAGFLTLEKNVASARERVTVLNVTGERLPPTGDLDFVFSYGVLHHIPEPGPVVRAACAALRPGGTIAVWLYGKEGNRLYLSVLQPLRALARSMPHGVLLWFSRFLLVPLWPYTQLCRVLPLPLRDYLLGVFAKLTPEKQVLNIYDQLNPACAKYYTEAEARTLLADSGFVDVRLHHRRGYSWTAVGTKPSPNLG